jgi:dTDP-4-dehydrorhamnose 3,5-epimerase-like enzyme
MIEITQTHKDERGYLFELFHDRRKEYGYGYVVMTRPGFGRDVKDWHFHDAKSEIFVCVSGSMVVATMDERTGTVDVHRLTAGDGVFVPIAAGLRHSVLNNSSDDAVLLAMCDRKYDSKDEHREKMTSDWSWDLWRAQSQ